MTVREQRDQVFGFGHQQKRDKTRLQLYQDDPIYARTKDH